jgi:hypothetical protein
MVLASRVHSRKNPRKEDTELGITCSFLSPFFVSFGNIVFLSFWQHPLQNRNLIGIDITAGNDVTQ